MLKQKNLLLQTIINNIGTHPHKSNTSIYIYKTINTCTSNKEFQTTYLRRRTQKQKAKLTINSSYKFCSKQSLTIYIINYN